MGLGILEDKHMHFPPGTAKLSSKFGDEVAEDESTKHLKRDGDNILIPQPTDDPNDPLNWQSSIKNSIICILGVAVAINLSTGGMLTPGLPALAQEYHVTLDEITSTMVGGQNFATGALLFFVASGATIWGKRPFFIIGTILLILTCVWGFLARSFLSLAAARIIQGMAAAPVEALVTPVIADIFFVHQRGSRLAIWNFMIGGGIGLGNVISGFIIAKFGAQTTFAVTALVLVVLLPFLYFVVWETTYVRRDSKSGSAETTNDSPSSIEQFKDDTYPEQLGKELTVTRGTSIISEPVAIPSRKPFKSRLHLFNGRFTTTAPFWKGVIKPFTLLAYPAVLYTTILNGSFITYLIIQSLINVTIFEQPPYNLNPSQVGLTSIPSLIVSFIFSPISGILTDWVAKYMSRHNKGIFEPEFRLIMMAIAVPLSTASFVGFGIVVSQKRPLWLILIMSNLQGAAVPFAVQAAVTYVLDCYPHDSNQAFVVIQFARTVFTFIISSKVNGLYVQIGPRALFNILAGLNICLSLFTIPTYIYGKRLRSMVARSKLAKSMDMT